MRKVKREPKRRYVLAAHTPPTTKQAPILAMIDSLDYKALLKTIDDSPKITKALRQLVKEQYREGNIDESAIVGIWEWEQI